MSCICSPPHGTRNVSVMPGLSRFRLAVCLAFETDFCGMYKSTRPSVGNGHAAPIVHMTVVPSGLKMDACKTGAALRLITFLVATSKMPIARRLRLSFCCLGMHCVGSHHGKAHATSRPTGVAHNSGAKNASLGMTPGSIHSEHEGGLRLRHHSYYLSSARKRLQS